MLKLRQRSAHQAKKRRMVVFVALGVLFHGQAMRSSHVSSFALLPGFAGDCKLQRARVLQNTLVEKSLPFFLRGLHRLASRMQLSASNRSELGDFASFITFSSWKLSAGAQGTLGILFVTPIVAGAALQEYLPTSPAAKPSHS